MWYIKWANRYRFIISGTIMNYQCRLIWLVLRLLNNLQLFKTSTEKVVTVALSCSISFDELLIVAINILLNILNLLSLPLQTIFLILAPTFTSKLFSFIYCSPSLILLIYVFQQTPYYASLPPPPCFFITQDPVHLVFVIMVYGNDILKFTALNLKMDPTMSFLLESVLQLDFVT